MMTAAYKLKTIEEKYKDTTASASEKNVVASLNIGGKALSLYALYIAKSATTNYTNGADFVLETRDLAAGILFKALHTRLGMNKPISTTATNEIVKQEDRVATTEAGIFMEF